MAVQTEVLLTILSTTIALTGTWIGFQKFSQDARDRDRLEQRKNVLMENNLQRLEAEVHKLAEQVEKLFEKLDDRCDQLENNQKGMSDDLGQVLRQQEKQTRNPYNG